MNRTNLVLSLILIISVITGLFFFKPFQVPRSISFIINGSTVTPVGSAQIVANIGLISSTAQGLAAQGDAQAAPVINELLKLPSVRVNDSAAAISAQGAGSYQYVKTLAISIQDISQLNAVSAILERFNVATIQTSYRVADPVTAQRTLHTQLSTQAKDKAGAIAQSHGLRRGKLLQMVENPVTGTGEQTLLTQRDENNQLVTELSQSYTVTYELW